MTIVHFCPQRGSTCSRGATLAEAAELLVRGEGGSLAVLDPDRRVLGTLSEVDIALAIARFGSSALLLRAEEIMDRDVVTGHPEDEIREVLRLLVLLQERRLHLTDSHDRWFGSVSIDDLLCHQVQGALPGEVSAAELIGAFCQIGPKQESCRIAPGWRRRIPVLRKGA